MKFLECLKSAGKIFHGDSYLWSTMKKSSVSRMQMSTYFQILCYVLERRIRTQHQILLGKKNWVGSKVHHNTELWTQLTESRWNSSGIFSQDSPHCSSSTMSTSSWPKCVIHHNSKDELSSCRCSMRSYGDLKTMNGNAMLTTQLSLFCKKIPTRTLIIPRTWIRKEVVFYLHWQTTRKMESLNRWWSDSEKADTQFSVPRVHCPEERSKAKEVENYQYTFVFSHNYFCLISSVPTEQSQVCVMNTGHVKQERGDPCWQNNLTHCSRQQVGWWQHLHVRLKFLRKNIYCKNTKNEWKGSHNKTAWKNCIDAGFLTTVEVGQYFMTKHTEEFSQFTEPVACRECTLGQEMKNHLIRKVGFEGTP